MLSRMPQRVRRKARRTDERVCIAHRAWVRRYHCSVPGCNALPVECAHVRGGTDGGTGLKPSDRWIISLCSEHHAEQHRIGEPAFQRNYGIDLQGIARSFAEKSPHLR